MRAIFLLDEPPDLILSRMLHLQYGVQFEMVVPQRLVVLLREVLQRSRFLTARSALRVRDLAEFMRGLLRAWFFQTQEVTRAGYYVIPQLQ